MTDEKQAGGEAVLSRFAPAVVMPGGGTVTPEGWMWVPDKEARDDACKRTNAARRRRSG